MLGGAPPTVTTVRPRGGRQLHPGPCRQPRHLPDHGL